MSDPIVPTADSSPASFLIDGTSYKAYVFTDPGGSASGYIAGSAYFRINLDASKTVITVYVGDYAVNQVQQIRLGKSFICIGDNE